jgi:integrase
MTYQEYIDQLKRRSSETSRTWKTVLMKWAKDLGYDSPDSIAAEIKAKGSEATNYAIKIIDKSVGLYAERGLASKTVNSYFYAIRGFLRFEDVELPADKLKNKVVRPRICIESYDRAPTIEEVRRLVSHAPGARLKALILLLASSGMRVGEAVNLKVGNFDFDSKPTKVMVGPFTKTRQQRVTFITEEATNALKDYLGNRAKDPNSQVFLRPDGQPVTKTALRKQAMRVIEKAGLMRKRTEDSYTNEIHVHCFRKFFKTRLTNAQMPDATVEMLLGHMNQNDRSYFRATEEELAEAYAKSESALTIFSVEPKGLRESMEWVKQQQEGQDKALESMSQQLKLREAENEAFNQHNKVLTEEIQRMRSDYASAMKAETEQIQQLQEQLNELQRKEVFREMRKVIEHGFSSKKYGIDPVGDMRKKILALGGNDEQVRMELRNILDGLIFRSVLSGDEPGEDFLWKTVDFHARDLWEEYEPLMGEYDRILEEEYKKEEARSKSGKSKLTTQQVKTNADIISRVNAKKWLAEKMAKRVESRGQILSRILPEELQGVPYANPEYIAWIRKNSPYQRPKSRTLKKAPGTE